MRASTVIGGTSEKHARKGADFYPTPPECTQALLNAVEVTGHVWEPACGDGAITAVLLRNRLSVTSTDLHDRGFGRHGVDFLHAALPADTRWIITNPPFDLAADFICRARSHQGVRIAMLLKATYWHAKSRYNLFCETGPSLVLPMTWRPAMAPERGKSATMDFCWTVWGPEPAETCAYIPITKP